MLAVDVWWVRAASLKWSDAMVALARKIETERYGAGARKIQAARCSLLVLFLTTE